MPRRPHRSEQARSTQRDTPNKVPPKAITLPNPEVGREPDNAIRISTKTFNCYFDAEPYTYGYRLELRDVRGRNAYFNKPGMNADVKFAQTNEQLRQFGSLLQARKDAFKNLPGMEKFPGMVNMMSKVDPILNSLSAELSQLRSLTKGVLPQKRHIQCAGHGDWFAYETLVQKAADMDLKR
ncbi:MAG: hypothetical protein Q9226_008268 [Calogaya cf. arnoldii]